MERESRSYGWRSMSHQRPGIADGICLVAEIFAMVFSAHAQRVDGEERGRVKPDQRTRLDGGSNLVLRCGDDG